MSSRERVRAALNHEETDRVPRLLYGEVIGYVPAIRDLLTRNCAPELPRDYFDMDITGVAVKPTRRDRARFLPWHRGRSEAPSAEEAVRTGEIDEWGVWWQQGSFHHYAQINSPLAAMSSLRELERYPWPDLDAAYRYEGLSDAVGALHDAGFAVAGFPGMVFEQAWYLRGMENLLIDMMTGPDLAHALLERTAYFQREGAKALAHAGVDILITGDDVGTQNGMMMSVSLWREFLKWRLAETVRAAKTASRDVKVFYHSDGNIEAIIPDLIDVGIDILNPIQPECMDPADIKEIYGDRLCFWGTVSLQRTMPFGTPEEVEAEVRERIRTVGKNGGLILAPAHVLGPDVPWENIRAFFRAADE